jgi:hypothetical protein
VIVRLEVLRRLSPSPHLAVATDPNSNPVDNNIYSKRDNTINELKYYIVGLDVSTFTGQDINHGTINELPCLTNGLRSTGQHVDGVDGYMYAFQL